MFVQAFFFVVFMVTLAYYSTLELASSNFLIVPSVINGILLFNEFFQIYSGGWDYFKDIWNYADLLRSSLFYIYAIEIWTEYFTSNPDFLAFIILVTWVRGVTYFRIFGPTRYLINLLFEVFLDIPSFLIIYFYTILAFSFIFFALNTDDTIKYYNVFVNTYSNSVGNTDEVASKIEWLFYVLITLFNFTIMLNLLISILSDTYKRVKDNKIVADTLELALMIQEVEMMLFWRRGRNDKQFLHICRSQGSDQVGLERIVVNKFRGMTEKCKLYEHMMDENLGRLNDMKENMELRNLEFKKVIKKLGKKYQLEL